MNFHAFDLAILVAAISPGPAFVLTARTSLSVGRKAGLLVALGVVLAASTWLNAAFFGLSAVLEMAPWLHRLIILIGGCYLLYLAFQLYKHARDPFDTHIEIKGTKHFINGYLINILNPKAPIYVISIIALLVPIDTKLSTWGLALIHHFIIEMGWLSLCVFALANQKSRSQYLSNKIYFDRVAGGALAFIALFMLYEQFVG